MFKTVIATALIAESSAYFVAEKKCDDQIASFKKAPAEGTASADWLPVTPMTNTEIKTYLHLS